MAGVVDRIGYDPVQLGSLSAGRLVQPGGALFGVWLQRSEFERAMSSSGR